MYLGAKRAACRLVAQPERRQRAEWMPFERPLYAFDRYHRSLGNREEAHDRPGGNVQQIPRALHRVEGVAGETGFARNAVQVSGARERTKRRQRVVEPLAEGGGEGDVARSGLASIRQSEIQIARVLVPRMGDDRDARLSRPGEDIGPYRVEISDDRIGHPAGLEAERKSGVSRYHTACGRDQPGVVTRTVGSGSRPNDQRVDVDAHERCPPKSRISGGSTAKATNALAVADTSTKELYSPEYTNGAWPASMA